MGEGWTYICEALDLERFAMMPVAPVEEKGSAFCAWAASAERDGAPVRDDPATRSAVARMCAQPEVARMLQRQVVCEAVKGGVPTVDSSVYKRYMTALGQRVADWALDRMGPAGRLEPGSDDALVGVRFERSYRYTVVDTIGAGASEVQKNIIARRGLGLHKSF